MKSALRVTASAVVLYADSLSLDDLRCLSGERHLSPDTVQSQPSTNTVAENPAPRVHVHFTQRSQSRPVLLISRRRAFITTAQSHGIAHYAGVSPSKYLQTCYLVAMTQLRALADNSVQEPEYFECQENRLCLFSWHPKIEDYAHVFERRIVCDGCRRFYLALGVERELMQLQEAIAVAD